MDICVYTYTTSVFGHTSSPMTLGAVLIKHLQKYSDPTAVDLSQKLYVDNLLSGVQSEVAAITYFEKAHKIMQEGHFVLRQWCTNSASLQEFIRSHNAGSNSDKISLLGLLWDMFKDTISFQEKHCDSPADSLTKCKVLSIASQLFDPLGLVLPVTIVARLFITELWEEKPRTESEHRFPLSALTLDKLYPGRTGVSSCFHGCEQSSYRSRRIPFSGNRINSRRLKIIASSTQQTKHNDSTTRIKCYAFRCSILCQHF